MVALPTPHPNFWVFTMYNIKCLSHGPHAKDNTIIFTSFDPSVSFTFTWCEPKKPLFQDGIFFIPQRQAKAQLTLLICDPQ